MKVYIAGPITGVKKYKKNFAAAEYRIKKLGHSVMNPARLPPYPGFGYEDYMAVSHAMQERCDAVFILPGWQNSCGACREYEYAAEHNQPVFDRLEDMPFCC